MYHIRSNQGIFLIPFGFRSAGYLTLTNSLSSSKKKLRSGGTINNKLPCAAKLKPRQSRQQISEGHLQIGTEDLKVMHHPH